MDLERRGAGYNIMRIFLFAALFLIGFYSSCAAEDSGPARYRIETLKHITAEQGIGYLTAIGIGPVSQLGNSNKLLVTASSQDIYKASALLGVADCDEHYVIEVLCAASEALNLPSNERISKELADFAVGKFSDPPAKSRGMGGIIDIHKDSVLLISPESQVGRIKAAIEKLKNSKTPSAGVTRATKAEKVDRVLPADANQVVQEKGMISSELELLVSSLGSSEKAGDANEVKAEDLLGGMLETLESQKPAEKLPLTPVEKVEQKPVAAAKEPDEKAESGMVRISHSEYNTIMERLAALETKAEGISSQEKAVKPEEPNVLKEPQAAASQYTPGKVIDGNEVLDIELPEQLTIEQLLAFVGEYLHLDYMYDPTKVKGDVALKLQGQLQGKLRVKDLYPLLESVLKFRGFAMTRKGNLVTIVESASALDIDPVLVDNSKGKVDYGDVTITRIFQLSYLDVDSAKNLLISMKLANPEDINTSAGQSGILIVTGYAFRMGRIEELLSMVDVPGEPKQFRSRQLKYTMSLSLTTKVKSLADQLGTISITIAAGPTPAPARPIRGRPVIPERPPSPTQIKRSEAAVQEGVFLEADERTNRILMIGLEAQLNTVEELIDTLDVQKQDLRTLRIYDIKNVGAEDVLQKLQDLGIVTGMGMYGQTGTRSTRSQSRITGPTGRTVPGQPGQPQQQAVVQPAGVDIESGSLVEEPQVIVVEATNSLLVNATPEQHEQIVTIISYVDAETQEYANPYEIYSLENQDPVTMSDVLQKLIQETIQDKEGKVERVVQRRDEEIVIVPDENTFSIIVYASRKNQEWIGKLIRTLDKRRPQVLIDVTLVEISENDAFYYDLQMITKFPKLDPGSNMDFLENPLIKTFPSKRITEATSVLGEGKSAKGFYSDRHIQALLDLMETKGYGRVLAKPRILVNDNELGNINTKQTIYVPRTSQVSQIGTGQAAGTEDYYSTSYTFDSFESGIDLNITPHISEGNLLRLEIEMARSSQPPPSVIKDNTPPPTKTENNIKTIVTVPDESTIILGGILQLEQTKNNFKVPILGDIPVVGGLFRKIDNSSTQSKLYIFVKANVLRPEETGGGLPDLVELSKEKRAAFERAENKFQTHRDWPGIKSEPMDPLKVLEAE